MNYTSRSQFRSSMSRRPIKLLIGFVLAITFFGVLSINALPASFRAFNPIHWLTLSTFGVQHFFLWQIFSYPFVHPPLGPITLNFLIHIFFNLYILWLIGGSIYDQKGKKSFFWLFFGSSITAGTIAAVFLYFSPVSSVFGGTTAGIYSLLIAWMMLYPEVDLMLFFFIRMKTKWLVIGALGVHLFLELSNGNFLPFIAYSTAAFFGYLYSVIAWEQNSPFRNFHPFEKQLIRLKHFFLGKGMLRRKTKATIFDFKTGETLQKEEIFIDECLAKVSKKGKSSLSLFEKLRLKRISKKRNP